MSGSLKLEPKIYNGAATYMRVPQYGTAMLDTESEVHLAIVFSFVLKSEQNRKATEEGTVED
jgi:hypothetical protein